MVDNSKVCPRVLQTHLRELWTAGARQENMNLKMHVKAMLAKYNGDK